jgi:hypothetical protein
LVLTQFCAKEAVVEPQTKEETFLELEDIALADLYSRKPEKRAIWSLVWGQEGGKDDRSRLEASLTLARDLPHPVLHMLLAELRREDSIAVNGLANYGFPGGPGAAELLTRLFPPLGGLFSRSAEQVQVDLIDLLTFRDIYVAHGTLMIERARAQVKELLGIRRDDPLAVLGARSYGMSLLFEVLDIAACFGAVELHYLTRLHPPRGPHGGDDVMDAMDSCVCMTTPFAEYIARKKPSVEKVMEMLRNGCLAAWGISPTNLDQDELHEELAKLHHTYASRQFPKELEALAGKYPPNPRERNVHD